MKQSHVLKTHPKYFEPVYMGLKTFEIRRNDRGFQPLDTLNLLEWDPETEKYTMRSCLVKVIYILPGHGNELFPWIPDDYVIMSIRLIARSEEKPLVQR